MPNHSEPSVNASVGRALQKLMPTAAVRWENTRVIVGEPSWQPDIIVTAADRSPVVIEAEFEPARGVEPEAKHRLGHQVQDVEPVIETAFALRYPESLRTADDLDAAVASARYGYCVRYQGHERYPTSGWIAGGLDALAELVRLESVPRRAAEEAADAFELGVDLAEPILRELSVRGSGASRWIAESLGMEDVEQTRRMACAIVLNAIVFHEHLAPTLGVKPFSRLLDENAAAHKMDVLREWRQILQVDYWPIFANAFSIVHELPIPYAHRLINTLWRAASTFALNGVMNSHNIIGRVFQRLIADRRYLATFYTLPASATLLAKIAVEKMADVDWSDRDSIARLRVGDFACGTGALLLAFYQEALSRYELAGNDPAEVHTAMLEDVLTGCDVMPSAVHITASTLSGARLESRYERTRLFAMPYGRDRRDGGVHLGSLDLLNRDTAVALFGTGASPQASGPTSSEEVSEFEIDVADGSFDLVIMNPPFTSNTMYRDSELGVKAAAFAAFDTSEEDQEAMSAQLSEIAAGTCHHGNAGLGSAFAALGNRKVKPGGVVAYVLPLTALRGQSWQRFREMLASEYTDLTVASLVGDDGVSAFSADTGLAECLVVARKLLEGEKSSGRAEFISLRRRPLNIAQAAVFCESRQRMGATRRLEDGPYGGNNIRVGDEVLGESIDAPIANQELGFGCARLRDATVGQVAFSLSNSRLWLPNQTPTSDLPLARLHQIGARGLLDRTLIGRPATSPFTKHPIDGVPTFPALWNRTGHDEVTLEYDADASLEVIVGREERADEFWRSATRLHVAREFAFNLDRFGAVMTAQKTLGGRSWPSVIVDDEPTEALLTLWLNSTLGLLTYWWTSSRQQGARGGLSITRIGDLVVPDARALDATRLDRAMQVFDEMRATPFEPAYLADLDDAREMLDRRLLCEVLGLPETVFDGVRLLAQKWCAEPSVNGGRRRA